MSGLERKLEHDKAMRDAARRLVEADLGFVRGDVQHRGLAKRAVDSVGETSLTLADRAMGYAKAHPLAVSGGLVALLLVLLRNPILDLILGLLEDEEPEDAPAPPPDAEADAAPETEPGERQDRSRRRTRP